MQEIAGHAWGTLILGGIAFALVRLCAEQRRRCAVAATVPVSPELHQALQAQPCGLCRRGCNLSTPRCRRGEELRTAIVAGHAKRAAD